MAGKKIRAFAPANISCFVKLYKHKNPRWAGSYGVGFTVNHGVIVAVSQSKKTQTFLNKKKIVLPTVEAVVNKLTKQPLRIAISTTLPLGCGFGLSGACAIATAYAVNKLLKLKKSREALAIIAHTAEIENKTGLGTVVNQFYGGFFLKAKPSSHFLVKRIPVIDKYVYSKSFSKLLTKTMLNKISQKEKIDKAGTMGLEKTKALLQKKKKVMMKDIIHIAKEFVVRAGLLNHKKVTATIEYIEKNGGAASMLIFGNGVYSDTPFPGAIKLKLSDQGAHLL